MSRDKAWQLADAAKQAAYDCRRALLEQTRNPMFGSRAASVPTGTIEILYILELMAASIQEMTLPDHPLRLQDLQVGPFKGEWWR